MSNVFGLRAGTPYFQVPDSFVLSGDLRDLSGMAVKLYLFLCREINRTGQVELEYTNEDIYNYVGIKDHTTVKKAREELKMRGRIRFRKGPSQGFIYVMLDNGGTVLVPAEGRKAVRLRSRPEKAVCDPLQTRSGVESNVQAPAVFRRVTKSKVYCDAHRGQTVHWNRDGELICEECHPNPKPTSEPFRPPTAKEIGFT
jgi:hypothetical protein